MMTVNTLKVLIQCQTDASCPAMPYESFPLLSEDSKIFYKYYLAKWVCVKIVLGASSDERVYTTTKQTHFPHPRATFFTPFSASQSTLFIPPTQPSAQHVRVCCVSPVQLYCKLLEDRDCLHLFIPVPITGTGT